MTSLAAAVQKNRIPGTFAILFTVAIAVFATIYSLTHSIYEVFPFLYFLPLILFIYQYPNRGVLFSLVISTIFLLLVYYFGNFQPNLIAVSTAWFVIFVTIGVVTSSFAEGLRAEERKYRGIFENSQAGIFTFDPETQQIREINGKFARMLNYERGDLINLNLSQILSEADGKDEFVRTVKETLRAGDIELFFHTRDNAVRQFLVSASLSPGDPVICSAVDITEKKIAEQVISRAREDLERRVKERTEELEKANENLRSEIQERKRFEAAIRHTNHKLSTLSSITRHDILSQISAITTCLSAAGDTPADPAVREQLAKIGQITDRIREQISFARDFQNIGENLPQWQSIGKTIENAISGIELRGARVEKDLVNIEISADPLLGKVFHILVENSLRHGKKVTVIRFSYRISGDDMVIVCEDDGVGIPGNTKEQIFRHEYTQNAGYGLFLAHEILSVTGISIREIGVPGIGARFEIQVPASSFRFIGQEPVA